MVQYAPSGEVMIKRFEIQNLNPLKRYVVFDLNTNSKIYRQNGLLYKVPRYFTKDLTYVLEELSKKKLNSVVQVKEIYTKNNKDYAYSMRYYKGYKSIRRFKNREISLKVEDCKKIIKAFYQLGKRNMIYYDFHKGNVLLRKDRNNIVICDLDGLEKCRRKEDKKIQLQDAVCLCAAYLYNVDFQSMKAYIRTNKKLDSKNILHSCMDTVGTKEFFQNVNRLSELDEEDIKQNQKRIKQSAKQEYKEHFEYYRNF